MVFNSGKKDDPLVVNLSQNMEFHDNFHIGKLKDSELKHGGGQTREQFRWIPQDAINRREAERGQKTLVKPGNVLRFGQGQLSPRKIIWLLPDFPSELPDEVRQSQVGVWLHRLHYQKQAVIQGLEVVSKNEPQIMDKVRLAIGNSELDDQLKETVNEVLTQHEDHSQKMRRRSNSSNQQ